ncbi:MAG: DUF6285 domain-containing protein [Solirubrobacterales bacterium]
MFQEPTVTEMLDAIREHLLDEVVPETSGSVRYHARVSANLLAIIARQLDAGAAQEASVAGLLDELGCRSEAELAARVRAGELPISPPIVAAARAIAEAELAVNNPRYLRSTDA